MVAGFLLLALTACGANAGVSTPMAPDARQLANLPPCHTGLERFPVAQIKPKNVKLYNDFTITLRPTTGATCKTAFYLGLVNPVCWVPTNAKPVKYASNLYRSATPVFKMHHVCSNPPVPGTWNEIYYGYTTWLLLNEAGAEFLVPIKA